jgi:hypothetical protein
MALESSTYINGLVVLNPTGSDNISQGDDHIRLLKSTIKATFPNVTGAVSGTHTAINSAVTEANAATNANTASKIVKRDGSGNFSAGTITAALSGNASTASTLQTARTIGGVSFNGGANINLPGVNTTGNQNTSGNAATATQLATARTIGGVSFNGSANINLPGVNTSGNQNTTGNSATASRWASARTITLGGDLSGSVSIRGDANVTLTGAVANNSHTHTIGNVTGLQSALDGKLSTSGNAASASTATTASTAGRWTTARTITLLGDLSGSASIRGDANVTITAAVANDSHTHDSRYFTESEVNNLLAGKLSTSGTAANSQKVDGFSISTASSGSDANTIYFRT